MTATLSHPRDFRRSVLGTALVAMATWWGFGLPYSLFSWLLDPMQLRWVLICYVWEVPAAGCLGPVLFPLLWFRAIERHWDHTFRDPGAVDPAEAAALEREILDFPVWVAFVFVVTSLAGYGVGAVQVRLFSQLPATEVFKIMGLGLATGLVGGLFAFLYLESLLAPLLRRFGTLWAVVPPAGRRVPLREKVFACSLIVTLTALVLLGTIFYSRGERVLEEQIGQRILAEAHHVAADLEQQGAARARDATWWREQVANLQLGPSGYAYLIERDGTVVAGASAPRWRDTEGFRPSVTRAVLSGSEGVAVDRMYTPRIIAFTPLGVGGERIVAVAYRHDFEGELDSMLHRGLVVFLASLVLALAQGILFSRRLTRPIEEVTALAGAIARAPGGPWETVAVRTNDEVGELATAFNQMIVRLEEARTELERRIAAATRNIGTLYEVARTTTSTLEVAAVLELVAEKTLGALGLGRLLVLWHPPELGDAVDVYAAAAGHPGERLEIAAPLDLAGLCPGARSTLIAPARLPAALADRLPAPRLLCLPLVFKGDLLGGILAGVAADGPAPDLALADALASQAAAALANAGLFETLRQKEGELRKLSHLRAQAQEESLRAMSRELHDGFGQVLTVVSMDLGMLERARDLDAPALRARLREVRDQLSRLMQDVRTMSQVLRPPMLDFGLVPTLHWFVEKFTESSEIEVRLQTPPEETRLPPPIELLLYRVAQEALTNVAKHARARHVDVELAVQDARVTLTVADDGVGFEVDRFRRTPSLAGVGLLGMRERVAYYHGELDIRSPPNAGVRIRVAIPLDAVGSEDSGPARARVGLPR
ncbi:MAG: HAMP domain-containing protein [Deltaproteobacteria bacterium]|nr:MAG: HAMP domain-containing protein [Deltaproteobacteria bacterium]